MSKSIDAALAAMSLDTEKPARVMLVHPVTGEEMVDKAGKPAFVDVYSTDSQIADKARRRIRLARQAQRVPGKIDLDAENAQLLAACTASWHLVDLAGNPIDIECTPEDAAAVYSHNGTRWINEQVTLGAGFRANFAKASSSS